MAEKIPGWLERVLLPQISDLKGEIKVVNARIDGLDAKIVGLDGKLSGRMDGLGEKIDGVEERLESKIDEVDRRLESKIDDVEKRLETRIDEVDKRLGAKIDDLDKRLDMTQRLAVVETQLKIRGKGGTSEGRAIRRRQASKRAASTTGRGTLRSHHMRAWRWSGTLARNGVSGRST